MIASAPLDVKMQSFSEVKRNSARDFEKLRAVMRLDLGTHKETRLKRAGYHNTKTLLDKGVAADHGKMLAADYKKHCATLTRDDVEERLRFLTVLHSVVGLEKGIVIRAVKRMEAVLRRLFDGSGAWLLGAVEVEIVNIELYVARALSGDGAARQTRRH